MLQMITFIIFLIASVTHHALISAYQGNETCAVPPTQPPSVAPRSMKHSQAFEDQHDIDLTPCASPPPPPRPTRAPCPASSRPKRSKRGQKQKIELHPSHPPTQAASCSRNEEAETCKMKASL